MTRARHVLLGLSSLLVVTPTPTVQGSDEDPINWLDALDPKTFEAAGLDKLTDEELQVLGEVLIQTDGPSFLEMEAMGFMEENRWKPVYVAGGAKIKGDRYLMVWDDEGQTLLEAWSIIDPLPPPGTHWAKDTGGWEILNPDGTVHRYSD